VCAGSGHRVAARLRQRVWALALILGAVLSAAPGLAQTATTRIPLQMSPATARAEAGGREIVLIFPAAISPADIATLERATGSGLVEGLNMGQDAARLRLSRPAQPRLEPQGRGALLILEPAARGSGSWPERRLALAEAEVALRAGDAARARETVAPLLAENPQDTALIERMAAIEAAAGRTRTAIYMYERALGLDPGASSLLAARRALAAQQGPYLRAEGFAVAAPGGERVASGQLWGGTPLRDGWRADFRSEVRYGAANNLRQAGQVAGGPFHATRARGEIAVERQWENGGVTRLAALAAARSAGVGLQHSQRVARAEVTAQLAWNQSYWDTLMAFAGHAVRDRAALDVAFRPAAGFLAQLGGGYVRYGLPGASNVAQGAALAASLTWTAPERWMLVDGWQMRVGYRLGAEYLSSVAQGMTANGTMQPLLDVRSREVHSLEAAIEGPIGPARVTVLGGYAYDRFGGSGPVGLIRVANQEEGRLSFGLEGGVAPSLAENPRAVWRLGGFVLWRFGA
jgi:hypothetical protein